MKHLFVAALFALLFVGCDKSSPVASEIATDAPYSVETMYKATVATDTEIIEMHGDGPAHDSIRHGRMLGHIKEYVGLTDAQFDSVKVYAQTLFVTLKDIRKQVHDSLITKEQARELVVAARTQFVDSIKFILTAEQIVKFDEWVTNFWNKPPRRGPGGRGGHDDHGGPGGPGRHGGRP